MPNFDVEIRLAAGTYPNVFIAVKYTDSSGSEISLDDYAGPKVAVTLLPDPASNDETVALRLEHLLEGGNEPFDLSATTVTVEKVADSGTIAVTTHLAGWEYSFTMPAYDVVIVVQGGDYPVNIRIPSIIIRDESLPSVFLFDYKLQV
jgi:hypothetical protein